MNSQQPRVRWEATWGVSLSCRLTHGDARKKRPWGADPRGSIHQERVEETIDAPPRIAEEVPGEALDHTRKARADVDNDETSPKTVHCWAGVEARRGRAHGRTSNRLKHPVQGGTRNDAFRKRLGLRVPRVVRSCRSHWIEQQSGACRAVLPRHMSPLRRDPKRRHGFGVHWLGPGVDGLQLHRRIVERIAARRHVRRFVGRSRGDTMRISIPKAHPYQSFL